MKVMNPRRTNTALFAITAALLLTPFASAIELGSPFRDNAILQRDMPLPVWGTATPGAEVRATLAGKSAVTKAGEDGSWKIELPKLAAGGPYKLDVSAGSAMATTCASASARSALRFWVPRPPTPTRARTRMWWWRP